MKLRTRKYQQPSRDHAEPQPTRDRDKYEDNGTDGVNAPQDQRAVVSVRNNSPILTRRAVLQATGYGVAAVAFTPPGNLRRLSRPVTRNGTSVSVMPELSTYLAESRNRELPGEVIEKVKHHTLDTLAAMVSGAELPPGRSAIQFARNYGGEKVATIAASNVLCGPIEAALVNGMLAHSDETDDSNAPSLSHPGCAVVPAALAIGERFGIDGTHFLRAIVLGYDVGPRVVLSLGGPDVETETHRSTHSISAIFGAAAAAGCAANLTSQQMCWLLDYTAQQSSGIAAWKRDTDHIEKAFVFAGMNARSGATSALLVQSGWTGIDDIFSGSDNYFLAYALKADPTQLIDKLGERYEVTRTNIKKWTVGSPIQAPLDALENLMKRHPMEPNQVKQVIVRVASSEAGVVNNREMPDICLQHMMAVMLIDKTASFRAAHDKARMKDPAVLRERAKVQLVFDPELEKLLPKRVAIVEITLTDGTRLTDRVDAVRGTAENPMTRDEVIAKARDLMTPVIGTQQCEKLIQKIFALGNVKDIRELRPLLQHA
ncbi:MAG: MmgE/PrpD family protein [Candidatus Acidiferrales bacterium]